MGRKENRDTHMPASWVEREDPIPAWITIVHLLFLAFTVLTAHYQMVFIFGLFIGTPLPEESVFVYEPPNSNLNDHARESARPEFKSTGSSDMGEWWDDSENIN